MNTFYPQPVELIELEKVALTVLGRGDGMIITSDYMHIKKLRLKVIKQVFLYSFLFDFLHSNLLSKRKETETMASQSHCIKNSVYS